MGEVLVTGATGTVGNRLVELLRDRGDTVRALSRRSGPGLVTGDLTTGEGIEAAVDGVDTIVHLATTNRDDSGIAQTLVDAIGPDRSPHLVLLSIVGIDRNPLPYYRGKLATESVVTASGVPHTILRATQFHSFVASLLDAQRYSPVLVAPSISLQPIDVDDLVGRLIELVDSTPAGRVPDIGGPEVRTFRSLAEAYRTARGSHRPIMPLRLPGATFRAYRTGAALVPGGPTGEQTFEQFLAARDSLVP
ncbi:NmrA family transcriptional regulator [Agromyces sp. Root81]|uniref:SDR family oxidoreductase n=1 Tax=Agromyces sp. Root81 TaxID=1736601 RepID=UPI0006F39420|nr:NAD(P)H-binding protein [Agromyces sp. Root81]KRC63166.1 NmrA family transcriptional regulator [Agromyces sp. Root81]